VPRYQEALNERGEFEHIKSKAVEAQEKATKERDSRLAELIKLREQNAMAESELAEARKALSSSAVPEVAEFSKLRDEVVQVRNENERLQKRIANMQNDLEYAQNEYQNCLTAAANSASELRELQVETERLRAKADANIVQIHEIQSRNDAAAYVKRIRELKIMNEELERQLETKAEELRALMNGRRATRGTSVPRSPRMGTAGTMSPGPRRAMQSVMGVLVAANGSRGNSPAPGEQIPRASGFAGEALFQGTPRNWGHHLQQ
jgi:chromosome segregation ATPase